MQKHFPVGKVQRQVLAALGLTAEHYDDAEAIFGQLGLSVQPRRAGRTTEPVVTVRDRTGGGWTGGGDGETWQAHGPVDLTPIMQWVVNKEYAERVTAAARRQAEKAQAPAEDDGGERIALLDGEEPATPQSSQLSWGGTHVGTEMVSWPRQDGWYSCLRGVGGEGNAFESDDWGPYASREEAEGQARDAFAIHNEPVRGY